MGFVDYICRHPVGKAANVPEMDNTFVVPHINAINRLILPSAKEGGKIS